jgi:hypothetical protein
LKNLVEKEEFRLRLAKEGLEKIEAYNFENSRKNLERLVE